MAKNLYVGNIGYQVTEDELRELFEQHGTVRSLKVITDKETGRARGFAFVEMETEEQAQAAISALNGREVAGRSLNISEARPREVRRPTFTSGRREGRGRRY